MWDAPVRPYQFWKLPEHHIVFKSKGYWNEQYIAYFL